MKRLLILLIGLLWLSGCGYVICRGFGNTPEQCAYDCTYAAELDEHGQKIPDPHGRPEDYKVKKTCTYNLRKVLFP